jgi:hypothetical protein
MRPIASEKQPSRAREAIDGINHRDAERTEFSVTSVSLWLELSVGTSTNVDSEIRLLSPLQSSVHAE